MNRQIELRRLCHSRAGDKGDSLNLSLIVYNATDYEFIREYVTVERVKAHTQLPVCVGFGISKREQVRIVCEVADGAVVGSHLVNVLHNEWNQGAGRRKLIEAVSVLKSGTTG